LSMFVNKPFLAVLKENTICTFSIQIFSYIYKLIETFV